MGAVLCEGLFFNESWDYTKQIIVEDLEETSKGIEVNDQLMVIVNAAVNGRDLLIERYEDNSDYCAVELENGDYKVKKILVRIEIDNNYLERMGIELFKV